MHELPSSQIKYESLHECQMLHFIIFLFYVNKSILFLQNPTLDFSLKYSVALDHGIPIRKWIRGKQYYFLFEWNHGQKLSP